MMIFKIIINDHMRKNIFANFSLKFFKKSQRKQWVFKYFVKIFMDLKQGLDFVNFFKIEKVKFKKISKNKIFAKIFSKIKIP